MKSLIVDMSPVFYRWLFSTTTISVDKMKLKKNEDGKYNFNEYKSFFIFKVIDYISNFKNRFDVDEVILALDKPPYWRSHIWSGYKSSRNKDESEIDWKAAQDCMGEIADILDKYSSFKVIGVPSQEGDDVGFVLAEYLSKKDNKVILKSVDHDWVQNLEHPNVSYWETKHTVSTKSCGFVDKSLINIPELKMDHVLYGDMGDYVRHIVSYSQFSPEFVKDYPNITPIQVWDKRHEIDIKYLAKKGVSAYKHPRFGKKSFEKKMAKEGFTLQEYIDRDPVFQKNYDLNEQIVLSEGIPPALRQDIIDSYENANTARNEGELASYFMSNNIIELVGRTGLM